jgi:hypothetical protein
MIFTLLLFILTGISFILQDFVPDIAWAWHSYVFLVAIVFFACAISVPFPVMLIFAWCTGFLYDMRSQTLVDFPDVKEAAMQIGAAVPSSGFTMGLSIFLLGLLGSLIQGIRPLFRRGRWELPVLMTGISTALFLVFSYLWINFRRGGFVFPREVWYHILTTALLSMFVAPLIFLLIDRLAKVTGYQIRYEGLARRRWTTP